MMTSRPHFLRPPKMLCQEWDQKWVGSNPTPTHFWVSATSTHFRPTSVPYLARSSHDLTFCLRTYLSTLVVARSKKKSCVVKRSVDPRVHRRAHPRSTSHHAAGLAGGVLAGASLGSL